MFVNHFIQLYKTGPPRSVDKHSVGISKGADTTPQSEQTNKQADCRSKIIRRI